MKVSGVRADVLAGLAQKLKVEKDNVSFLEILKEAVDEVNKLQREADKKVEDFVLGKVEDIHDVMVAIQKADIAFRLIMEIRDRAVEAYREIVRMQV